MRVIATRDRDGGQVRNWLADSAMNLSSWLTRRAMRYALMYEVVDMDVDDYEELPPSPSPALEYARLENTKGWLWGHLEGKCAGERCTLHNRSNHTMREFPQLWRSDWGGFMERVCPHGIGHPDPDEYRLAHRSLVSGHGCDGCCAGAYED